jgi:iron complex outermembrane receptor protein
MKFRITALAASSLLAIGSAASAQTEAAGTAQNAQAPGDALNDIVVTARRRSESQQDVPIAITAIAGSDLAKQAIINTADLKTKVPGMAVQDTAYGGTQPAIGIRGQIQKNIFGTSSQSIGVYLNDIVLARMPGLNSALYDLESVQVLKGPQGTLFGRNTPGGAVLFTTKLPGDRIEGYAQGTVGNYELRSIEAGISVPVVQQLSLRFAGRASLRDGYVYNINTGNRLRNEDSLAGRFTAVFEPSETIKNVTFVDVVRDRPRQTALKATYAYPNAAGSVVQPYVTLLKSLDFHTADSDDSSASVDTLTIGNTTNVSLGENIGIKNIFGYRKTKSFAFSDIDGTPRLINTVRDTQDIEQFSDELQLSGSSANGDLQWIIGGFWFRETGNTGVTSRTATATSVSNADIVNSSQALFAQATWKLPFYRAVSITGGARYSWDQRGVTWRNFLNGNCNLRAANTGTTPISPCVDSESKSFTKPTYTLAVDWKVASDLLLYATTRRGYRSGGFDLSVTTPASRLPYDAEVVTDYEAGFKANWHIGPALGRLNFAVYHSDYTNMQRNVPTVVIENGTTIFVQRTQNAASAVINGYEIEAVVQPIPGIELSAFLNETKPRYTNFVSQTGVDMSAQAFSSTPERTAGIGMEWTPPLPHEIGRLSLRGDYYYQSKSYEQDNNTNLTTGERLPQQELPAYSIVNLRADFREIAGTGLDIGVFVKNVFDEEYYASGVDLSAALGVATHAPGDPRTYGVQVSYHF